MIYIAICDDNVKSLKILYNKVNSFLKENVILAEVEVYSNSKMLQYDVQEGKYFDLILSDIEMPEMDGMKLVSYIKSQLPDVLIIFITSYLKYAVDAFELSVFRYIPKNSMESRLPHALRDAIKMIQMQSDNCYIIQMPSRVEKIPYKRILYIQREGKNSIFVLNDSSITKIRKSLGQVMKELDSEDFVYIERGTIVNLGHIEAVNKVSVRVDNGAVLYPSQAKVDDIKAKLSYFWRKQL